MVLYANKILSTAVGTFAVVKSAYRAFKMNLVDW